MQFNPIRIARSLCVLVLSSTLSRTCAPTASFSRHPNEDQTVIMEGTALVDCEDVVRWCSVLSSRVALLVFLTMFYPDQIAATALFQGNLLGFEDVRFAGWAGGEPGEPHYYRIHDPTSLIEHDNTQNGANHIHTVWRDPQNDWGETDPLSDHYARSPRHRHPHETSHRGPHPVP